MDIKEFVANKWVLVSWYINWDKNFNIYNWFVEPSADEHSELINQYQNIFNTDITIKYVIYSDVKSIESEIERQKNLSKSLEEQAKKSLSNNTKK